MINTGITADQLPKYIDENIPLLILDIRTKDRYMAEEFSKDLYDTLHNRLLTFPAETKIFPTHHGDGVPSKNGTFYTTVQDAKKLPLLDLDKDSFVKKVVSILTPRPMNYSMIIRANKGTMQIMPIQIPDLEMGPNRCSLHTN